ncbi:hypothetical protein ACFYOT_07775 [Saccharothrix saharensis]|uniref:hypothetical protein n=1 Tax=Saccharothrix saharensis TaxID=571190 RepID=UPI003689E67F
MLGVLGLVFGLIPAAGLVAWPLVVAGPALVVLGAVRAHRGRAGRKGVAIRITVDSLEHRTATASGPHARGSCSG